MPFTVYFHQCYTQSFVKHINDMLIQHASFPSAFNNLLKLSYLYLLKKKYLSTVVKVLNGSIFKDNRVS